MSPRDSQSCAFVVAVLYAVKMLHGYDKIKVFKYNEQLSEHHTWSMLASVWPPQVKSRSSHSLRVVNTLVTGTNNCRFMDATIWIGVRVGAFLVINSTINQFCIWHWVWAVRQQSITWNAVEWNLRRYALSQDHNGSMIIVLCIYSHDV